MNRLLIALGALLVLAGLLWPLNPNYESLFAPASAISISHLS